MSEVSATPPTEPPASPSPSPGAPWLPVVTPSLGQQLARSVYSMLIWLLQPAYLLRLLSRSVAEPQYRRQIGQRWGFYSDPAPDVGEDAALLWVHAVSLGETRAAAPLIQALRERHPLLRVLLTHGTATGWQAGAALLRPGDRQVWLPLDTPGAVARFLQHFNPVAGVLLETEIWPNLLHQALHRGIPMLQANARLSVRSLRKGLRLAPLMRPAVQSLSLVLAQSEEDALRLQTVGVPPQRAQVCGNLKFDMTPDADQLARGRRAREALRRPVVLAASTREGEEGPLLQAWQQQLHSAPKDQVAPLLLLVPRHPQRFEEVIRRVQSQGLSHVCRSALSEIDPGTLANDVAVCIGDSMGELPFYYAMSHVALLGGSFAPLGGQNLIEAAACGCPIVMGPHTFNFTQAAELALAAGAAQRVGDVSAGVSVALAVAQSHTAAHLSQRALAFATLHRGAAARMALRMADCFPSKGEKMGAINP